MKTKGHPTVQSEAKDLRKRGNRNGFAEEDYSRASSVFQVVWGDEGERRHRGRHSHPVGY